MSVSKVKSVSMRVTPESESYQGASDALNDMTKGIPNASATCICAKAGGLLMMASAAKAAPFWGQGRKVDR